MEGQREMVSRVLIAFEKYFKLNGKLDSEKLFSSLKVRARREKEWKKNTEKKSDKLRR
jgi:hypothetical protein